ncbi:MAG: hypothetical protein Q8N08_09530, partial [Methanobacteriaceae archaeon]|nr:hypothetical protein [Methanobacteriaceae archaeon]
ALRAGLGILVSLLFLITIPLILKYSNLDSYSQYLPTFLLILSMLFGFLTYLRQQLRVIKKDGQLTLDEAIQRANQMHELAVQDAEKNHEKGKRFLKKEKDKPPEKAKDGIKEEYDTPLKEEPPTLLEKEPLVGETPEKESKITDSEVAKPEPGVAQKKTDPDDVKPLKEGIITRKDKSQTTLKEESKPSRDESQPLWRDEIPPDKGGIRSWDLLLVLLLTGLSVGFLVLDPLQNPVYTSLIFYLSVLFLLGYSLLVLVYPSPDGLRWNNRILVSILIGLLVFYASFFAWRMQILPFLPLPLFYIMGLAVLVVVFLGLLRRRFLPEEQPPARDILVEHDEEDQQALPLATAEEPPQEIIVEHDENEIPIISAEDIPLTPEEESHAEKPITPEEEPEKDEEIIIEHDEETLRTLKEAEARPLEEEDIIMVEHDEQTSMEDALKPALEIPEEEEPKGPLIPRPEEVEIIIPEHVYQQAPSKVSEGIPEEEVPEKLRPDEPAPEKEASSDEMIATRRFPNHVDERVNGAPAPLKTPETDIKTLPESEKKTAKISYWDLIFVVILSLLTVGTFYASFLPVSPYLFPTITLIMLLLLCYTILAVIYPTREGLLLSNHIQASLELALFFCIIYGFLLFYKYVTGIPSYLPLLMVVLTLLILVLTLFRRKKKKPPAPDDMKIPAPGKDKLQEEDEPEKDEQRVAMFPWIERQKKLDEKQDKKNNNKH